MPKKINRTEVVLAKGKMHHRYLKIKSENKDLDSHVVSIVKYVNTPDGKVGTSSDEFDGYMVFMHGSATTHGRTVATFSKDRYLEAIITMKEMVTVWMFNQFIKTKTTTPVSRKWILSCIDHARQVLNMELRRHREAEDPQYKYLRFYEGEICTVSPRGDRGMDAEARPFFGQRCILGRRQKNGFYEVRLESAPHKKFPFPKRNIDPLR